MYKKRIDPLKIASYIILTIGLIIVVLPMFYMVVSAFRDNDSVFTYPPKIFPQLNELSLTNFKFCS